MAMLIIGGERTVLHGSDPDMLALSVLHEARRRACGPPWRTIGAARS